MYAKLAMKRHVKWPLKCPPGTEVIIEDIHPADPLFDYLSNYRNAKAVVRETILEDLYSRTENMSINPTRRSYAACNLDIYGEVIYFEAVRFRRAVPAQSTFYNNLKKGR